MPHGGQVIVLNSAEHILWQSAPGQDGESPQVEEENTPLEDCPDGGVVFTLNEERYTVCAGADGLAGENGAPGENGENGENGANSAVRINPADLAACPEGGSLIEFGLDTNGNGLLDPEEDVFQSTSIRNGTTGDAGLNTVIRMSPADMADCEFGGTLFESGLDTNRNGVLDLDEDVLESSTICKGEPGEDGSTPEVTLTDATATECPGGGSVLTVNGESTVLCALIVEARDLPLALGALAHDEDTRWNGQALTWQVVHHGYGALNDSVALRSEGAVALQPMSDGSWHNRWDSVSLRFWLNDTFSQSFSPALLEDVQDTNVS